MPTSFALLIFNESVSTSIVQIPISIILRITFSKSLIFEIVMYLVLYFLCDLVNELFLTINELFSNLCNIVLKPCSIKNVLIF